MKRGFLKGPGYKDAVEEEYAEPEPEHQVKRFLHTEGPMHEEVENATTTVSTKGNDGNDVTNAQRFTDSNGKDNEIVIDRDEDAMDTSFYGGLVACDNVSLTRLPPQPRGWGRHARETFLHTIPKSLQGKDDGSRRKRAIFRFWPRRPKSKPIIPTGKHEGTLSPDGYPWGATLYDFYAVERLPRSEDGEALSISYMTGSALLQTMRTLEELDVAKAEIEWALSEGKPRDEGVADTAQLIKRTESQVQMTHNSGQDENETKSDHMETHTSISHLPSASVTSPFHPSHYPKPWPLVPFETTASVLLQERIPFHLLPQTLYVHDPFKLLSARNRKFSHTAWNSRPDIIVTYDLKLARKDVEEARKMAEDLEEFKARTRIIMRYMRTEEQVKNDEPVIEVPLPSYPRRMTRTDESQLYLSPIAKVGDGHHSIVYKAEWELPRDIFVRPNICEECFKESTDKEIERVKNTERWAELLSTAAWGSICSTAHRTELDQVSDTTKGIIERTVICVVPPNATPSHVLEAIDEDKFLDLMKETDTKIALVNFTKSPDEDESTKDTRVRIVRIDPPFSYETCAHGGGSNSPVPRTAMFTVIAKLSLEDDPHLEREASNYENFPAHFFHHYSGYTLISQLRAVVPVHAIVPQFYGYYTPRLDGGEESYMSPILLLEHCGKPIDPEVLSINDHEECMSMVLRFQRAGWLHESLAPRNFLVQDRKPTEFPTDSQVPPEPSFRLIDFGRSRKIKKVAEKRDEESASLRMFRKLDAFTFPLTLLL